MPFTSELLKYVGDVFVETGTFQGDTTNMVATNTICTPSKVISLELSDVFFDRCTKRFANTPNVCIVKGNSKYDLYDTIKDIQSHITFWLDSHWSYTPDVGCDPVTICPVLYELDQIKQHPVKTHTILIDDIRLMNNTDDRFKGFPVRMEEILSKLMEINPNYTIKYYDDYVAQKDVLVAYINKKQCIHTYLTTCKTNTQPPGFADYLRGTVALYNFSELYGYELLLDGAHPVFRYLKTNEKIIQTDTNTTNIIELLPPLSYPEIYVKLSGLFNGGTSFSVLTNSFYNAEGRQLTNFGVISDNCKLFLKDVLSPSVEVESKRESVFNTIYGLNIADDYTVIHLRFGDDYIHGADRFDNTAFMLYYNKVRDLVNNNPDTKYVLISDSCGMANHLKTEIPELYYWDNNKIHLGDLMMSVSSSILDTMVDFFIMTRAKEIISNGSGFSMIVHTIYDIKYTII